MSLSTKTLKRLSTIKTGLIAGLNCEQIGVKCGVTEKTIDRDIVRWVDSGLFEIWLKEEFLRLHTNIIHDHPVEAYRQVSKLVGKMLTHKVETKSEHVERKEIDVNITTLLAKYEATVERATNRIITKNNPRE